MKIHLVVSHPEEGSFNQALHKVAEATFRQNNIGLNISDLYADKFDPVAGKADVINYPADEYFTLSKAQRWGQENNAFADAIQAEQQKLSESDLLIFQFPLWWSSFPAVLKGWIDRVFTSGFVYGKEVRLAPKKVMYSVTTGDADNQQAVDYYRDKIESLYQDVFGFLGWQTLPPFIAHGVQRKLLAQRKTILKDYRQHLLATLEQNPEIKNK